MPETIFCHVSQQHQQCFTDVAVWSICHWLYKRTGGFILFPLVLCERDCDRRKGGLTGFSLLQRTNFGVAYLSCLKQIRLTSKMSSVARREVLLVPVDSQQNLVCWQNIHSANSKDWAARLYAGSTGGHVLLLWLLPLLPPPH